MSEESIQQLAEDLAAGLTGGTNWRNTKLATIPEIQRMLERRGYENELKSMHALGKNVWPYGGTITVISLGGASRYSYSLFKATWAQATNWIDTQLGNGQHHMECYFCKHILLRSTVQTGWEYRDAATGPWSSIVRFCPGCGLPLTNLSVREICDE